MNWKNLKNIIRKELKESNLLTENIPSCCGYVHTGQGFACCKGYHQHMGQYPCAGGSQNQWTNAMQGNGEMCSGKTAGPRMDDTRYLDDYEDSGELDTRDDLRSLREATSVTAGNTKFNLRTGVNKNPTKLGIKIQFEPLEGGLESETKAKLEVALQEKLNIALSEYDIQISKDTDVPRAEVIGFFIPLSQVKNLIIKSLTGKKVEDPTVPAPSPEGENMEPPMPSKDTLDDEDIEEMIAEQLLREMKVGTLNEISKVVAKEDFYEFINKGNNIIRTLEENNFSMKESKNYLKYLIKHNIM
tara:strand:- start:18 stop:920 length:903 start_codon:yes stop_codon:yes gene_type:complete